MPRGAVTYHSDTMTTRFACHQNDRRPFLYMADVTTTGNISISWMSLRHNKVPLLTSAVHLHVCLNSGVATIRQSRPAPTHDFVRINLRTSKLSCA